MIDQIMRFDVSHLLVVKIKTKSSQSKKKSNKTNSMHINDREQKALLMHKKATQTEQKYE